MKRFLSVIIATVMMFSAVSVFAEDAVAIGTVESKNTIGVIVNGEEVDCLSYGQEPVIVEGRTLVPLRAVFEALGASVEWNNETKTAESVRGDVKVFLAVNSNQIYVNEVAKTIDVPAQLMNNRTMVPVRAVAEAFGCFVNWDNDTRTVVIDAVSEEEKEERLEAAQKTAENVFKALINGEYEKAAGYVQDEEAAAEIRNMEKKLVDGIGESYGRYNLSEAQKNEIAEDIKSLMAILLKTIKVEITSAALTGKDSAQFTVVLTTPAFDKMKPQTFLLEEEVAKIFGEEVKKHGYTAETVINASGEEMDEIMAAVSVKMVDYMVKVIINNASVLETVVHEPETITVKKVDGKWLITK